MMIKDPLAPSEPDQTDTTTSVQGPILPPHIKFQPKELAQKMGMFYTVPLFDREEKDETGKSLRKFYLKSHNGSQLTAEYILVLLRHLRDIIQIPRDIQELIREDNDINVWGELYALNSTDINSRIADNISGNRGNVSAGNAGNISVAYFTPYISQVCKEAFAGRGIELAEKAKLLSQDQFDQLQKIEAYLVMDKENVNIGIPLKNLPKEDLDAAIEHWKHEGYTPVRLLFDNLVPGHANVFNTKPINDRIKMVMRNEVKKYFELRGLNADFLSGATLRSNYGVVVQDAVKRQLTNNGFWCTFNEDKTLREIYVLKYKELYFAKANSFGQHKVIFSENSFVDKSVKRKEDVLCLTATASDGITRTVEVQDLDIYNVFERTNYNGFLSKNAGRGKNHKINLYDYLIDACGERIEEILSTTKELSTYHGDNLDDESIQKLLQILTKTPDSIFSLVKTSSDTTGLSDLLIQFKPSAKIGVTIAYYDRAIKETPKKSNENGSVINFVNLHKSNLAFEREKAMTVLFVQAAVMWLKQEGHTEIKIELEKTTNKKTGGKGYLDCAIYSEKDGVKYGQIYEFKSWYDFDLAAQETLREQCVNYEIKAAVTKKSVQLTYNNENIDAVKGMNLTRRGAYSLKGQSSVPWLPKDAWPFEFPEVKSAEQKDCPILASLLDIDEIDATSNENDVVQEAKDLATRYKTNADSNSAIVELDQILGFNLS